MKNKTLDKVKRECQDGNCGGYLEYWMEGTACDLYTCETCGGVHRWNGAELRREPEWSVPVVKYMSHA